MAVCVCLQGKFYKINPLTFIGRFRIFLSLFIKNFLTTSKRLLVPIIRSATMTCAFIFLPQSLAARQVIILPKVVPAEACL